MFQEGRPRWNQNTLTGRLKHFVAQVDPRLLFYTSSNLQECRDIITRHREGAATYSDSELWKAQYAIFARIHPDTGHEVFLPFSMPGFSPFCVPVCALMVMPGSSPLVSSLYQVVNQTCNAGFNYCNRNATKETTMTQLVGGYVGAVGIAVSVATVLRNMITKSPRISSSLKRTLGTFLPFPAVASANMFNLILMRNGEFFNGIEVFNEDGSSAGVSHTAAKRAIFDTALTRIVMPIPVFVLPPAGIAVLERTTSLFKKFPKTRLPMTVALSTLGLYLGIPLAVACFPQISSLPVEQLEKTCTPNGPAVFYNKGL